MGQHELDDLTVAGCGLFSLPTRFIHHAEAIVSVMHVGITFQKLARRGFRLIELALVYEIHNGVGIAGQFILAVLTGVAAEVASLVAVVMLDRCGGSGSRCLCQSGALGDLILL